ncbi:hypothetical protein LTR08_006907 [Meristemomyces frigidus]|nr:hypothetical protein LTR08_006907 [Meristemomyces frigidus]
MPDSSDPFKAPRTFTPVCLLSRAQLPLAYLDTSQHGSRLFSAHIATLEACYECGDAGSILVAEEIREKRLYAIERAQRRTYAICRLGQWVKRGELESVAGAVLQRDEPQVKRPALQSVESGQPWWSRAAVPLPVPKHGEDGDEEGIPRLVMKPCADGGVANANAGAQVATLLAQSDPATVDATPTVPMTAQEMLQDLAKHYQETLYLSRTSLAYFTKGPLSRVRAAVNGPAESGSLQTPELITFLREAIMTASTTEKKYREGIASIVNELPSHGLETPEQPLKAKRKRKWKSKRDKAGFYVDEKGYVEQWWRMDDEASGMASSVETTDLGLRQRIPRIQSRETHLQIILALEVLALEASTPVVQTERQPDHSGAAESQDPETQGEESQAAVGGKKVKPKKLQDLPALLDTLVERLCIWHSLESSPVKPNMHDGAKGMSENTDGLTGFCVEVVIPFFMSRIPQHAATVNKKLGGPSAPTPVKRKAVASRKPGEPATRQAPERQPRKPFARISSDALNHRSSSRPAPSLLRSATDSDSLLAHIKRENSETPQPLDLIPRLPQPRKQRTSLLHSLSSTRREVDWSATALANDAKLRKKADLDEKLREAITALRKPNRALAVREVAESADVSFAKATARVRELGQRAGGSTKGGQRVVLVEATPGRSGKVIEATPGRAVDSRARMARPLTSTFEVPQTGHRPRHSRVGGGGVEETPSRGLAKFMPLGLAGEAGSLLESPTACRRAGSSAGGEAGLGLGQGVRGVAVSPVARRRAAAVRRTPVKAVGALSLSLGAGAALGAASPNLMRGDGGGGVGGGEKSGSIYDQLGWEDGFDEELA